MKVRILVVCVLFLSAGLLFAGAEGESASGEVKVVDWVMHATAFNYEDPDVDLWRMMKDVANIQVNAIPLSNDVAADKINVMIASKDIADITTMEFERLNLVASKGPFVDIGANLDKMPNLKQWVDTFGWDELSDLTADDGKLYNMPAVYNWEGGKYRGVRAIMLRGDLLTNMDSSDIESLADLESAFINIAGNFGAPILSLRDMASGSTAFDLIPEIMNTSVQQIPYYNPATKKYENQYETKKDLTREAIATMARWYAAGVIHPEFASQPDRIWEGMLRSGGLAAQFEHDGRVVGDTRQVQAIDPSFYFDIIVRPTYNGVRAPLKARYRPFRNSRNPFIAADTEALEEIFVLFDHKYDLDNADTYWRLGDVEGVNWELRADGTIAWPWSDAGVGFDEEWDAVGKTVRDWMYNVSAVGYSDFFRIHTEGEQMGYRNQPKETLAAQVDYLSTMQDMNLDTYWPPTPKYGSDADLAADIKNNVTTYVLENYIKFINGSKPMDEYDSFVNGLDQLNYGDLVALANEVTGL